MTQPKPRSIGYECKHVHYARSNQSDDDLLVIKEYEHFEDGTSVPKLRLVRNYERDFWVTREMHRTHQEKKEWEDLQRLQKYKSTDAKLANGIRRALGQAPSKDSRLRMVCRSPYVYGADVTAPVLVKHHYMEKWPDRVSINTMAAIDAETDMETEEIIMLSVTMKKRVRLIVVESFMYGVPNPEQAIRNAAQEYLGDILARRQITIEIEFVKNAGDCAARAIQTAHEWKPDFLAAWNMDYDIPKMIEALVRYGYDPNEVFPDPSVPAAFRNRASEGAIPRGFTSIRESVRNPADFLRQFGYIQGKKQKVTASGDTTPLHPAEQWHRLDQPASWYMIDPMCVYLRLRIANGKEPTGYGLDAILMKHLGLRKLKFTQADGYTKGAWHLFMQKNYKAEYCVYNIFDSVGMEILDEETTDLGRQVSSLCGHSEYHRFPSQPRRLCDDLHFHAQQRGRIIGTTSDQMEIELDDHVVGTTDWIVTLPSFLVAENGLACVEEIPNEPTMIFIHVADLDVEGTYPNEGILLNISRETTMMELVDIEGLSERERRAIGVNISGGAVNAVEICQILCKSPSMDELLVLFDAECAIPA